MQTNSIIDEIKRTFRKGSMLTRLIYVNLGVYLTVILFKIFQFFFQIEGDNLLVGWLSLPAELGQLIFQPWSLISYMFLHQDFLHILFNMLWLFWLGKIFLEYLSGKQLLNVYLLGGLSGAALYILCYNLFPVFQDVLPYSVALGASAGVLAVVVATAVYVPDYTIYLLFLGPVKLKYIALASVLLDFVFLVDGNIGGHLAHIGGAAFGFLYISQLKKGKDISRGFGRFVDSVFTLFSPKPKMKVTYKKKGETDIDYNTRKATEQKDIDKILEKIAKSGYDSLSKSEKEILFRQSKNS